jgi:arylsulfatase A-like enzyme
VAGGAAGALVGLLDALLGSPDETTLVAAYLAAAGLTFGALLGAAGGWLSGLAQDRPEPQAPLSHTVAFCLGGALFLVVLVPLTILFATAFRNQELSALALAFAVAGLTLVCALLGAAAAGLVELWIARCAPRHLLVAQRAARVSAWWILVGVAALVVCSYRQDIDSGQARAAGLLLLWIALTTFGGRWLARRGFRFGALPWGVRRGALVLAVVCAYAAYQMATGSAPGAVAAARSHVTLGGMAGWLAEAELAAPTPLPVQTPTPVPGASVPTAPRTPPPSILLVTIDSARADHFSLLGYPRPTSPRLDAYSRRCVVFERAYAASSSERDAVPAVLAGRLPSMLVRDGGRWPRHRKGNRFLAEVLRDRGYRTAAVVSHDALGARAGLNRGFETFDTSAARPGERVSLSVASSARVASRATELLARAPPEQPFFLWAHFADPHERHLRHPSGPDFGPRPTDRYDAELAFTDQHLGTLLEMVDPPSRPLWVVVAGDHGESLGEHGRFGHGRSLSEPEVRVPLVICAPQIPPSRIGRPVSLLDLYPTLLIAAGVPVPRGLPGVDLAPLLRGETDVRGPVPLEIAAAPGQAPQAALIDAHQKLVISGRGGPPRLFDLHTDPRETRNLARARGAIVARLGAELLRLRTPVALAAHPRSVPRRVLPASEDAAEQEALRRAYEVQKRREQAESGSTSGAP